MKIPSCESNRGRNANSNWQIPQPFYQAFALQTSHMKQENGSRGKEVVWDLKRPGYKYLLSEKIVLPVGNSCLSGI